MKVVVTGGNGFLGGYVVRKLKAEGHEVFAPRSSEYDLKWRQNSYNILVRMGEPDAVVHLAAAVGGIGDNVEQPGRFLYENAVMGLELMEAARRVGVQKFLTVGTACMYPASAQIPMKEIDVWNGEPAFETASYAHAKRLILAQGQAYREQYDFNAVFVIPSNLYGPGDRSTHVMPMILAKIAQAKARDEDFITLWGTGNASRDFLYVEDCADGIVRALEFYDSHVPLNLGSGIEVPIFGLARTIRALYEWNGDIRWDVTRPEGTRRRCLDVTRAAQKIGWYAGTSLPDGLRKTMDWYRGVDL